MDPAKWGKEQPHIVRCSECGIELHLQKQRALQLCPGCAIELLYRHQAVVPALRSDKGGTHHAVAGR